MSLVKTTEIRLTDKTGQLTNVSLWGAHDKQPMVSTPMWAVRMDRKTVAEIIRSARRTPPTWQPMARREVHYFDTDAGKTVS